MTSNYIKDKLATLPLEPGCYQMKDSEGNIIYVGKAKKLKNRVSSYFTGSHNFKTTKLVSNIADFDFIVTKSEKEALILEINLIKKYRPKYNIQFMDDTSYPYIQFISDPYPKVEVVRLHKKKKKGQVFGPYPDVYAARNTVKLLENLYPLRKCKQLPSKVCLYYHMGQCLGPCQYDINQEALDKISTDVLRFLKGDTKDIESQLKEKMMEFAQAERFEQAQEIKNTLDAIKHVHDKQDIEQTVHKNVDVFNYYCDHGYIAINVLFIRDGILLDKTYTVQPLYDNDEDAFIEYIIQFYQSHTLPKEIYLPNEFDISILNPLLEDKIKGSSKGLPRQWVDTCLNNAKKQLETYFSLSLKQSYAQENALKQLKEITGIDAHYFEIFDNSHIAGSDAVAACVVWHDGFKKDKYRLFKVTHGADDLANMEEVFYRRYYRLLMEEATLPDIIFVDGAENQMRAVLNIKEALNLPCMICGLVKNDKHQTDDLILEDMHHAKLDKTSDLFYLLTQLQDEVHRKAITFHQKLRSKRQTKSILEEVDGLGPKRKKELYKHFKTFKAIKEASVDQLAEVLPSQVAQNVARMLENEVNASLKDDKID